ncbi:MAG: hypothetical protein KJ645_00410, partial [Planctomycetes bacterium]|nr:hypothetical protein [Planctomycetota bacterium]
MKKWFVLFLVLFWSGSWSELPGQSPSEILDDFHQTEETVFRMKNRGDYEEALVSLTDGFLNLTRVLPTASEDLQAELTA